MKKINYILLSFAVLALFACGESPEVTSESEAEVDTEAVQVEEEHDHDAMMNEGPQSDTKRPPGNGKVFFVNLKEGDMVTSPVKIVMGVEGMTVHPAGEVIEGTGHHHIILEAPSTPFGLSVPADEQHIHFGGGQTETEIELMPGPHMLTLQFADGLHRSYGEEMTAMVNIEVLPTE